MIEREPRATGRILVVDDTESNRYVLATWLRRAGHDVVEARTGNEGLALARTETVDLVVLDINLPDMSGYAVCERLKSDPRMTTVPVLHVSATSIDTQDRSEGLRRGADAYLVEPVERDLLVATVESLLRGSTAHRTAVRLARRLRALDDATFAVNESSSLDDLLATIVREASALFEASALALVIADDRALRVAANERDDVVVDAIDPADVDVAIAAIAHRQSVSAASLASVLSNPDARAYLCAPLAHSDGHRGVLLVDEPLAHADEATLVFSQFARAANNAIKNARSYGIERTIALALQQNLLPDAVREIAGIEVGVRYVAKAEHAEVGGDFYEVFPLDEHRVAFAIGDVLGHSLEAAMVMAQLRTAIRCYLLDGYSPCDTLERLNRLLLRFHDEWTATVCCAIYDRRTGRCELANAGHLPPAIRDHDGVRYLPTGGPLLGIDARSVASHEFALQIGDVLFLYTDGLIERRFESIDVGLARLATSLRAPTSDVEALCDRVLREAGPQAILDDIAIVAIVRTLADLPAL